MGHVYVYDVYVYVCDVYVYAHVNKHTYSYITSVGRGRDWTGRMVRISLSRKFPSSPRSCSSG